MCIRDRRLPSVARKCRGPSLLLSAVAGGLARGTGVAAEQAWPIQSIKVLCACSGAGGLVACRADRCAAGGP
eukprot:5527329-Alexandrium_andersonii.AAC.1